LIFNASYLFDAAAYAGVNLVTSPPSARISIAPASTGAE